MINGLVNLLDILSPKCLPRTHQQAKAGSGDAAESEAHARGSDTQVQHIEMRGLAAELCDCGHATKAEACEQ